MADTGPYRVGGHSPINIWCGPPGGGVQIAMATTREWAQVIVDALNAQDRREIAAEIRDDRTRDAAGEE